MADDIQIVVGVEDSDVIRAIKNHEVLEKRVKSLNKEYTTLDKLFNSKKLSAQDYSKAVQQVDKEIEKLVTTMRKGGKGMDNLATGMNISGKSARANEVAFQQAGYQIQDFIVQVQSGTNPLIAFSQQGSQLAGFFAGPWGASIGVAIAALSSFAMAILSTSGDTKTLKQTLEDLEPTNDVLKDFGKDFGKNFIGQIELVRSTFGNLVADIYESQIRQVQSQLSKEFGRGLFSESFAASYTAIAPSSLSGFNQDDLAKQSQQELEIQSILNKLTNSQVSSQEELARLYSETYDLLLASNVVSEEGLKKFRERGIELGLHSTILDEIVTKEGDIKDAVDDEAKAKKKVLEYQDDLNFKLQEQKARLLEAKGFELQALKLRKQAAFEGAYANVMAKAATEEQKKALVGAASAAGRAAEEAVQLAYETNKAKDAAKGFADNLQDAVTAMNSLQGLGSSIERALQVANAKVGALKAGADAAAAGTVAGYGYDIGQKAKALTSSGVDPGFITPIVEQQREKLTELLAALQEEAKLRDSNKSKGGAAPGRIDTQEEYLSKLVREYEMKRESLGLTDEQIKRNEFLFKMDEKIATMKTKVSETELKALHDQALAAYDLYQASQKMQDLIDSVADNIEDAFMSMVDGSKSVSDAFRDMLKQILLDIYRQQVVQPISDAVGGFLKGILQADGGAWNNGVQMFANGGVVSSPTMFGHRGGLGLMGEAGPEAIMPLKRGSNGKLGVQVDGSQGGVVVHQTFNFSANGDDSVKKIIAQAAPQIAQMTQKQIMDSRRRGGSMKATFG